MLTLAISLAFDLCSYGNSSFEEFHFDRVFLFAFNIEVVEASWNLDADEIIAVVDMERNQLAVVSGPTLVDRPLHEIFITAQRIAIFEEFLNSKWRDPLDFLFTAS